MKKDVLFTGMQYFNETMVNQVINKFVSKVIGAELDV